MVRNWSADGATLPTTDPETVVTRPADPTTGPPTHVVEARDLVLAWDGQVALDTSTFTIPAGTTAAIIGPNGSGKSTLLHAIAGLLPPRSGHLDVHTHGRPSDVAYVLQTTKVNDTMPVTVREAVMLGRYARVGMFGRLTRQDREACASALERLDIADLRDRHLGELSGGQRQRVFVAQGLVQESELLLLDEPITGLDLLSRECIAEVIAHERDRGATVVMTTHDLTEAQAADVVLLVGGRVVAHGPPDEALTAAHLSTAYGIALHAVEDGHTILDDPHHLAAGTRHVHFDRTGHGTHDEPGS